MINTTKSENYVKLQNENFNNWLLTRLRLRHKFRNEQERAAPKPVGSDLMLKKIEDFAIFTNAYSYKSLTAQNEFFDKLPSDLQIQVIFLYIQSYNKTINSSRHRLFKQF